MECRIREALMSAESFLMRTVEVDETFVDGLEKKKHIR